MNIFLTKSKWAAGLSLALALVCFSPKSVIATEAKQTKLIISRAELEEAFDESEDPIVDARNMLLEMLAEVESEYGIKMSLSDMCAMVKQNIHLFGIPEEDRVEMLEMLDLIVAEEQEVKTHTSKRIGWNSYRQKKTTPNISAKSFQLCAGTFFAIIPNTQAAKIGHELILNAISQ